MGDPKQAIFAFTGADHESIENIVKEFDATVLPLTYSFRCPKSVAAFARQWGSKIESTPDAPEGICKTIDEKEFWANDFTVNDVILCRNNAPLVALFFELLAKGIPAHIEGKDFSEKFLQVVNKFPNVRKLTTLVEKLEDWKEKQIDRFVSRGKDDKAEQIADVVNAIITIANNLTNNASVDDLKNKIVGMFQDSAGNKIPTLTLTTIHKFKGREADRVFWYGRNLYNPSKYAKKEWQIEAEKNLCIVAATRAKKELYDVRVVAKQKVK